MYIPRIKRSIYFLMTFIIKLRTIWVSAKMLSNAAYLYAGYSSNCIYAQLQIRAWTCIYNENWNCKQELWQDRNLRVKMRTMDTTTASCPANAGTFDFVTCHINWKCGRCCNWTHIAFILAKVQSVGACCKHMPRYKPRPWQLVYKAYLRDCNVISK